MALQTTRPAEVSEYTPVVREYEAVPAEREPGLDGAPIFTDIRERTPEEVEKLRAKREGERAEHYRWVYGLLGLRVVARRD